MAQRTTGDELRASQAPAGTAASRVPATCCCRRSSPCAGVTLRSVATSMGLEVTGSIHAEGDLDWRGTLAVDKGTPVGFKDIRLVFDIASDASDDELATLERLTERYCVVFQTLASAPELSTTLQRV